jgi:hypothetical protein
MRRIEFDGEDVIIDGVPSKHIVKSLKDAGLADDAITDLLGRMLAEPAVAAAREVAPFVFKTVIAETAPDCEATYTRGFEHPDFFDGLTVVQAGQTPEELGFNFRFHAIENEFDQISTNLTRLSNCLAGLRRQLFGVARELEDKITEIEARLTKEKEKEKEKEKDAKEGKEKEGKETKDKDKEGKDTKDKEKESKEGKDKDRKESPDKIQGAEKTRDLPPLRPPDGAGGSQPDPEPAPPPARPSRRGGKPASRPSRRGKRSFIRPEERPAVGRDALHDRGGG